MGTGREKRNGPRDPVNSYSKFWRDWGIPLQKCWRSNSRELISRRPHRRQPGGGRIQGDSGLVVQRPQCASSVKAGGRWSTLPRFACRATSSHPREGASARGRGWDEGQHGKRKTTVTANSPLSESRDEQEEEEDGQEHSCCDKMSEKNTAGKKKGKLE